MIRECPKCKGSNLSRYDYVACIDCNEVILPNDLTYIQLHKIVYSKEYINSIPRCQEGLSSCKNRPITIRTHGPLWAICQEHSDRFQEMYMEEMRRVVNHDEW